MVQLFWQARSQQNGRRLIFKHHAKTKEPNYSFYYEHEPQLAELKITAGQRTMSGLIADLTGQTPVLPVIFAYEHFIFHTVVA